MRVGKSIGSRGAIAERFRYAQVPDFQLHFVVLQNSPSPKGGTRHLPLWGKWNGASDYGTIRIQTKSVSLAAQKALDEIPPLGVRNQGRYL